MTEIPAHRLRRPRRLGRTIGVWWSAVQPLVAAGLVGGLVTYALMGGLSSSSSTLPGHNAAAGLIDAVRVGDPSACSMMTPTGARDLVRLLREAGATVPTVTGQPSAWAVCADALVNAPSQVRADAMRPFLGIVGLT